MHPVAFSILAGLAVVAGINAFGAYLWNRLNTLIHEISADEGALVGDHVGRLYTTYLFNQVSAGRFSITPKMVAIGNPERDRVIRAVKASDEFARIKSLAGYIRGFPLNIVSMM